MEMLIRKEGFWGLVLLVCLVGVFFFSEAPEIYVDCVFITFSNWRERKEWTHTNLSNSVCLLDKLEKLIPYLLALFTDISGKNFEFNLH